MSSENTVAAFFPCMIAVCAAEAHCRGSAG